MEGGGLGEEIRLAHTLLHLLVYIGSSDHLFLQESFKSIYALVL